MRRCLLQTAVVEMCIRTTLSRWGKLPLFEGCGVRARGARDRVRIPGGHRMARLPRRFWLEFGLAGFSAFLLLLTLVTREWMELLFRVDPDQGNGSLEWLVVVAALVSTVTFSVLARLEWQRARR